MTGANCSVYNCTVNRKVKGASIFKIPAKSDDLKRNKWRSDLISVVTRDRVVDAVLRKQIEENRVHICERHFRQDQLWICKIIFDRSHLVNETKVLN